jgi:ATP-binding cassette subfamily C protein CydCD
MKPVDRRVLPLLTPARSALAGVIGGGILGGALVAAQAFAVAALVAGLLAAPGSDGWHAAAGWVVGIAVARAAVGAYADVAAARAAGQVTTSLRQRVLRAAMDLGAVGLSRRRSGELGLLATRGVAAVEPYLTRFLPTLVVAAVLPPLTVALIISQDLWAGVIVVARFRWCRSSRSSSDWPPATARTGSTAPCPGSPATSSTSCAACPHWSPTTAPRSSRPGSAP